MLGDHHCDPACNSVLCEFDALDCIDETHPFTLYVSPTAASPQLGDKDHPFLSLSDALEQARGVSVDIKLLSGTHKLKLSSRGSGDPLSSSLSTQVLIRTLFCGLEVHPACASVPATVQLTPDIVSFTVKSQLTFENVAFLGSFPLKPDCVGNSCVYCPTLLLDLKTGEMVNDRGEFADTNLYAEQSLCDAYKDAVLFYVHSEAVLELKNVTFTNIGHQPKALIVSQCGFLKLLNVSFSNVIVSRSSDRSGVILWEALASKSPYYCGALEYSLGLVEYLNNGYELLEEDYFHGFADLRSIHFLSLDAVKFQYNNAYVGSHRSEFASSLIHVEDFRQIQVRNCLFLVNIASMGGAMNLVSGVNFPIINDGGVSREHMLKHVYIADTQFVNNTAAVGAALAITFPNDHQNVLIERCTFTGNFATERDVFGVYNTYVTAEFEKGTTTSVLEDGVLVSVKIPPENVSYLFLTVTDNLAPYISFTRHVGVLTLSNSTFERNGDFRPGAVLRNTVLESYRNHPYTYSRVVNSSDVELMCVSQLLFHNVYNLTVTSTNFTNGYCVSGSPGFTVDDGLDVVSAIQSRFSRLNFLENTGPGIVSLTVSGKSVTLSRFNFTRNYHTATTDPVCIKLSPSVPISVLIRSSTFYENVGLFSTVVSATFVKNLTLSAVEFVSNIAKSSSAGVVMNPISSENTYLIVQDSLFRNNSAISQGVIAIIDARGDLSANSNTINLQIQNSEFQDNRAEMLGSCVSSSGFLFFSSLSLISNSRFTRNRCADQGSAVRTEFTTGVIKMLNCSFVSNQGDEGAVVYGEYHSNGGSTTYIDISDCVFTNNTGQSLVMVSDSHKPLLVTNRLQFTNNTGSCVEVELGMWMDDSSIYKGNSAKEGTVFILTNTATAVLKNTTAINNKAEIKGGVAVVSKYSTFNCSSCVFENNYCSDMAGVAYVDQHSKFSVKDSSLQYNSCGGKGSVLFIQQSSSNFKSCTVSYNSAGNFGTISMSESNFSFTGSVLASNTAVLRSPGIVASASQVTLKTSFFGNQTAEDMGAFLFALDLNLVSVSDCVFEGGHAKQGGAVYGALGSVLVFSSSEFRYCSGEPYAGVFTFRICSAVLTNVTLHHNYAAESTMLLYSTQSDVKISDSHFSDYIGSGIDSEISTLYVTACTFDRGKALMGTGIMVLDNTETRVVNCSFGENVARMGGAIYEEGTGDLKVPGVLTLTHNVFGSNRAVNGGAVYVESSSIYAQNNTFFNNSAHEGNFESAAIRSRGIGGAIYGVCAQYTTCVFQYTNNEFYENSASSQGGGLYWFDVYPQIANNTWLGNTAIYGDEIASFPIRLAPVYENKTLGKYMHLANGIPVVMHLDSIASGQIYNGTIRVALVDQYDTIVSTDNTSPAQLESLDQNLVTVVGNVQTSAHAGIFEFHNISFRGRPGTVQFVNITSAGVQEELKNFTNDPSTYYAIVAIELDFRKCSLGETQQGVECYVCPGGTYSLDPTEPCKTCPSHATCLGNYTMVPDAGYWRPDFMFEHFFPCPNRDACLGSPDPIEPSLTGECASGYKGNLCNSCESGYSRQGRNMCNKCPNLTSNIVLSALVALGGLSLLTIAVTISIRGATRPRSEFAIYLKIFMNYIQMVVVAAALNVNWPGFVALFLNGQETAGSVAEQLFSFECIGQELFSTKGMFFKKIIVNTLLPAVLLALALFLWAILSLLTKMKGIPHKIVTSLVLILFVLHPSLTKVTFSTFACSEIKNSEFWLMADMDIRCWDRDHIKQVLSIALPSIVVWIFGLPMLSLLLLYRARERLTVESIQIKYSFLYKGYRPEFYYWEFVILYRKVALVCASVFLNTVSTMVQALSILAILLICLFLQVSIKPFRTPTFNILELKSLLVSLVTIYVGLYYQTSNMRTFHSGFEINIVLFVVILGVNIYFLFSWCRRVLPIVYTTIMNTFRRPRENYQVQPFVRVGPADNSDMSNSKSESVIRPGDSRSADLPPPNTTHLDVVYTLSQLERAEDFRKAEEVGEDLKVDVEHRDYEQPLDESAAILKEKYSP